MRRMITTQQTNYINNLSKVAEKGFKVGTYPKLIDATGILNIEESVQGWIDNQEVNFENHTIASGASLRFYYPELKEHYGLYGELEEWLPVGVFALDNNISIPETISTVEQLKEYILSSAFATLVDNAGVTPDEWYIRNNVANYKPAVQAIYFNGENIMANTTLECQEGEGQEIVGASDPIGVNTLDVENLRVENLQVEKFANEWFSLTGVFEDNNNSYWFIVYPTNLFNGRYVGTVCFYDTQNSHYTSANVYVDFENQKIFKNNAPSTEEYNLSSATVDLINMLTGEAVKNLEF